MPTNTDTHKSITAWLDNDLVARLDRHLAKLALESGLRASRQAWLQTTVRRALDAADAAQTPVQPPGA